MSKATFGQKQQCWRQAMRRLWLLGIVAAVAVGLTACVPPFSAKNESDVILRVTNITGISGATGEEGETLLSDVDPVFNDDASVELEAILKNPNVSEIGQFNDVQLTNY